MIRLLSLETSTDQGGFCLWSGSTDGTVSVQRAVSCPAGQPHAETLLPLLRAALSDMGWALADLDAVVFDAGPGMFTGLRVSAALAQGLAVAMNKPVIGVSSLEVLAETAYQHSGAQRVLTLMDARMNQIYAAAWERTVDHSWKPLLAPCLVNPDALEALDTLVRVGLTAATMVVAGTALEVYPEARDWQLAQAMTDSQCRYPDAVALAVLGARRLALGAGHDAAEAVPVYVRDRVALTTAERAAGMSL